MIFSIDVLSGTKNLDLRPLALAASASPMPVLPKREDERRELRRFLQRYTQIQKTESVCVRVCRIHDGTIQEHEATEWTAKAWMTGERRETHVPAVASMTVPPGFNKPASSAASIMYSAARSFTLSSRVAKKRWHKDRKTCANSIEKQ